MSLLKETYLIINGYSIAAKTQLLLLLIFVATLVLDTRINSTLLVVFFVSLLFSFSMSSLLHHRKAVISFISVYLLSVLSFTYSTDYHEGKLVLERQLALLLMPVLFFSCLKVTNTFFNLVIGVFFISIVCVCAYLLKCSAQHFLSSNVPISEWFVRDNLYHSFAMPVKMHATYLSLYVAMAIFIGFHEFLSKDTWWLKLLFFCSTILLVVTLTMLSSRVVISSVVFIIFFIYPFYIWELKHKFFLLIAGCAVFLTFFFVMRESSFIRNRFIEKIDDEIKMTAFLKADTTYNPVYGGETRADRWFCAIELIKEKPFFGYGTGSEKKELMKKYKKYNLQNAAINNYDAHNQYLAFAIKSGLAGLLVFLMMMVHIFYLAMKSKRFIYLSFILLFAIACVTEDVLESNKGIFFFAFFNTLFACHTIGSSSTGRKNIAGSALS